MRTFFTALLLVSAALSSGAEAVTTDFSPWEKSGTLRCEKKKISTVVHGEMQGGELRTTIPADQLKTFRYAVIDRKSEQGPWRFVVLDGLDRKEIKPIDPTAQKLNYPLSPDMAKGKPTVSFAIHATPDAVVEVGSFVFSDKAVKSGKFVARRATGPLRVFDTPNGKFTIPAQFEDVTPPIRREKVTFQPEKNDSGLRSYVLDDLTELHPNLLPSREEFDRTIALFAAPGQQEGEAFTVYALKNSPSVTVSATEAVSSADGAKLPAPEIRTVRVWPQRLNFVSLQYRDVPELLEKNRPLDIAQGTGQAYYLKVVIPENTKPGLYQGKITFASGKNPARELPYSVRVTNVRLDREFNPIIGIYYGEPNEFKLLRDYGLNSSLQGHQSAMRDVLKPLDDIARTEPDVAKRLEKLYDGQKLPQLNFADARPTGLDNFLKAYKEAGFRKLVVWIAVRGFSDRIAKFLNLPLSKIKALNSMYPEKLTPEYRKLFKDCIQAINERAAKSGIQIDWYQFDELGINSQSDAFAYAVEMFKLVKEAGGSTIVTCAEDEFTDMVHPYLDVRLYSEGSGIPQEKLERIRKATKKDNREFFCYTDSTHERPYVHRYAAGFNMWIAGWEGKYYWNLHSRRAEMFNDFDHPEKDSMTIYSLNGETIPTLQLEGIREGIDDFRYLWTLNGLIEKALKSPRPEIRAAGVRVRQELDMLKKSLPYWIRRDAEWDNRNFKRYRWRLSTLIEDLQNMLDGKTATPTVKFFPAETKKKSESAFPALLKAPKVSGKIAVDGDLSDSGWNGAFEVPELLLPSGIKPQVPTQIKIARDDQYLYLGFRCFEPDVTKLVMDQKRRDHLVWRDDCVEIFYDAAKDHKSYKQIIINPIANVYDTAFDGKKDDKSWNCPGMLTATKVGKDQWSLEVAIPLSEFPAPLAGINFMRTRVHFLSHVLLAPDPHKARNYADLAVRDLPDMRLAAPVAPLPGRNHAEFLAQSDGVMQIEVNGKKTVERKFTAGQTETFPIDLDRTGENTVVYRAKAVGRPETKWSFEETLPAALFLSPVPRYAFQSEGKLELSGSINMNLVPGDGTRLELTLSRAGSELYRGEFPVTGNRFSGIVPLRGLLPDAWYEITLTLGREKPMETLRTEFFLMNKAN